MNRKCTGLSIGFPISSHESMFRRQLRRFALAFSILVLSLLYSNIASATDLVTKLFTIDSTGEEVFVEITNTGTINATNRIFTNTHMPDTARAEAMTVIFTGAIESGMYARTTLVPGDLFFAVDQATGLPVAVTYQSGDFTRWFIPGGVR